MNRIVTPFLLAGLAGAPALAMQQPVAKQGAAPQTKGLPHTVRGELTLYEMTNYNGDSWVIDTASGAVHTDWNIRSVSIHPGDRWQICARSRWREPCIVLDRSVNDATLIGVTGQIGSARPAPAEAAQPQGN